MIILPHVQLTISFNMIIKFTDHHKLLTDDMIEKDEIPVFLIGESENEMRDKVKVEITNDNVFFDSIVNYYINIFNLYIINKHGISHLMEPKAQNRYKKYVFYFHLTKVENEIKILKLYKYM